LELKVVCKRNTGNPLATGLVPLSKRLLSEDCNMSLVFDQPAFRKHSEGRKQEKNKTNRPLFRNLSKLKEKHFG
jgi:hypothetical protein